MTAGGASDGEREREHAAETRLAFVLDLASRLPDAQLLDLHREVSRLAQAVRARDPVYQSHYATGVSSAELRRRAQRDTTSRTP